MVESTVFNFWRKCGSCKREIGFNNIYQVCNVSSCRKLVFCSVDCWDLHNPVMNHKNSWAEERKSPSKEDAASGNQSDSPRRIIISSKSLDTHFVNKNDSSEFLDDEILIVASKLKAYVKEKHDLNTSANVMEALSRIVRNYTDRAVLRAKSEGRKTLMDRDF